MRTTTHLLMKRKLLENDPCPENWDAMRVVSQGRSCEKCNVHLPDLTAKTIEDIAKGHYGRGQCVALTKDQVDFILGIKRIKKVSVAAGLFIGTLFFNANVAHAQQLADPCLVKGIIVDAHGRAMPGRAVFIYIKDSDAVYETTTDDHGAFQMGIPKNSVIRASNIERLVSKRTRQKEVVDLGRVRMPEQRRLPGFF